MRRRHFISALPSTLGTGLALTATAHAQTVPSSAGRSQDDVEIARIVATERWARDMSQWDAMQACFHAGARVDVSWLTGDATEFVSRSRQSRERGARSLHLLGPVVANVRGDRATADVGAQIVVWGQVKGVDCYTLSYARIVERLERRADRWGIVLLETIYQMDLMAPLNPAHRLEIDDTRLASYRSSYRFMSYLLEERGTKVRNDLAGADNPDSVARLYRAGQAWLQGSDDKA